MLDLAVIGAGPAGIAHVVLERGPLVATIATFPEGMIFHSAAANLEIAGDGTPVHDETTRETTVPGVYLAGRVCAGDDGNRIFIENGREHGAVIVEPSGAAARPVIGGLRASGIIG